MTAMSTAKAGSLYILMEYCGSGDLSSVIKQAQKHGRLIPEETIWHYFMQILLALHYCHHPNSNSRSSGPVVDGEGQDRRAPILHRFETRQRCVQLDIIHPLVVYVCRVIVFLSKVLTQASLANTYVGVRSSWFNLVVYLNNELCTHKSPFHEAKTHSELSMAVRWVVST
jgi:NIMA (never in mitosis gene a)-related kinase 2